LYNHTRFGKQNKKIFDLEIKKNGDFYNNKLAIMGIRMKGGRKWSSRKGILNKGLVRPLKHAARTLAGQAIDKGVSEGSTAIAGMGRRRYRYRRMRCRS
jgi:hypothetical protein